MIIMISQNLFQIDEGLENEVIDEQILYNWIGMKNLPWSSTSSVQVQAINFSNQVTCCSIDVTLLLSTKCMRIVFLKF